MQPLVYTILWYFQPMVIYLYNTSRCLFQKSCIAVVVYTTGTVCHRQYIHRDWRYCFIISVIPYARQVYNMLLSDKKWKFLRCKRQIIISIFTITIFFYCTAIGIQNLWYIQQMVNRTCGIFIQQMVYTSCSEYNKWYTEPMVYTANGIQNLWYIQPLVNRWCGIYNKWYTEQWYGQPMVYICGISYSPHKHQRYPKKIQELKRWLGKANQKLEPSKPSVCFKKHFSGTVLGLYFIHW